MTDKIEQIYSTIEERKDELQKISFSSPVSSEYKKISVRPILIKGSRAWQAERFTDTKVYHLNLRDDELASWVEECALGFSQICLFFAAALPDDIPANGNFLSCEKTTGGSPKLEFCRVPFDKLESIKVYPDKVIRTVLSGDLQKKHIVYKE
jgi:hypothetical protein